MRKTRQETQRVNHHSPANADQELDADALNHQTIFTYDAMSRLTKITYPDSTTSTFAYDSRGRRTSVTDQNSKTTTYAYDDADRLTSVTDAANHVTYYAYDTEGNLTKITDANSNATAFTYDAFGRVTKTTFPAADGWPRLCSLGCGCPTLASSRGWGF